MFTFDYFVFLSLYHLSQKIEIHGLLLDIKVSSGSIS